MNLPSREQRILDAIEYQLRVSDPALVSSFRRLAGGAGHGRLRLLRRWRYRCFPAEPGSFPLLAFIPLLVLGILCVVILIVPGRQQRLCQRPRETGWSFSQTSQCGMTSQVSQAGPQGIQPRNAQPAYPAAPGTYLPAQIRRLTHP